MVVQQFDTDKWTNPLPRGVLGQNQTIAVSSQILDSAGQTGRKYSTLSLQRAEKNNYSMLFNFFKWKLFFTIQIPLLPIDLSMLSEKERLERIAERNPTKLSHDDIVEEVFNFNEYAYLWKKK
ncbi:conserved hypothetical protein [Trichinella spiralis]|uniref:hypothetical protein n=1 Tax=Trichinella spiralis TaxID=6334 RepID=UPI0001EFEC94|nr:conserved hypothetical protein [Trichinella spiralis]